MATTTANPRVQQWRDEAHAKAEESATFLEGLRADQLATTTEIGWTVGATAAHLGGAASYGTMQLKQFKQGKAPTVPNFLINAANLVSSRRNRTKPVAESVAKLRENTAKALPLFDAWTDTDLDVPFKKPYFGAGTHGEALRYTFIGHYDEHIGQVKRALKM